MLQCGNPVIFFSHSEVIAFLKYLISRFVMPQHIVDSGEDIKAIKYNDPAFQLDYSKIYLGMITRSRQSDITPHAVSKKI